MAERLKRIGTGTILLPNRPGIAQTAAIVGKKEGEGPLHSEFDAVMICSAKRRGKKPKAASTTQRRTPA